MKIKLKDFKTYKIDDIRILEPNKIVIEDNIEKIFYKAPDKVFSRIINIVESTNKIFYRIKKNILENNKKQIILEFNELKITSEGYEFEKCTTTTYLKAFRILFPSLQYYYELLLLLNDRRKMFDLLKDSNYINKRNPLQKFYNHLENYRKINKKNDLQLFP